ncbi:MAG: sensor histidine kinase [Anaerocolumna sp.]
MKYNVKESIRQLLIRFVLPIRRKREKWMGNFRFSIAFRISLYYLKLLLIYGVLFLFLFSILYFSIEYKSNKDKVTYMLDEYSDKGVLIRGHGEKNPLYSSGITIKIVDGKLGNTVFTDMDRDITNEKIWMNHIFYEKIEHFLDFMIMDLEEVSIDGYTYLFYIQYDLLDSKIKYNHMIIGVLVIYLFIVYFIVQQGRKSDLKLLQPITEMSDMANRLTVNNLASKRLNIDGTKNELKDLAIVINHMLDRIEVSYESQKQFVSDASHELRTPIAVIQGYANLLNRWGAKNEEVLEESIDAINNESKSMQDLVEKLLFLSRHDKKTLKLEKHFFNMCQVVEEMVKETKLVTANRNIETNGLMDVAVYGDKQALKQAIRVFIDNAVKYTKDGDTITISCENRNGDCIITVEDTGIGMTRKDVENIFDRFYRSDQVRNEKIYGHGLGLSIAKLIILAHTGQIKVRSQFTKGTSFIITLPNRR